ncbi:hypothetical protein F2Q69_00026485 [Brassica cretica]|uniref:Lactate/malate dehydrogenase N-terminal domain-containing protein n=1 Tax=Brassica cretica TaxID=69181 RepID=A0A8S9S7X1_BRACR|nr:hypothetical protein F2Q69_00026485 [Brassica cretica]
MLNPITVFWLKKLWFPSYIERWLLASVLLDLGEKWHPLLSQFLIHPQPAHLVFSSTSKFHTLTPRSSSYGKSLSTKAHASSDNKKLYVENVNCSSKVTIIGSSLGIGPALSTSLKKSPLVTNVEVADHCPDAFIIISNRMLNSIVPMSAEVLKQRGVYDPKKLFGLMTPETELARAFVAERFVLDVEDVHVPVIGGHCSLTALPLFSKTTPHVILYKDDIILWTSEITYSINNSSEYLDYFAGNPDRFVLSLLRALGGANDMFQCCFVESNMFEDIPFFGSTVKPGKKGVEAIIETDLEGLTEYEVKSLKTLRKGLSLQRITRRFSEFMRQYLFSFLGL